MCSRRQIESFGRVFEQGPALIRSGANSMQLIATQTGVAHSAALYLQRPGFLNTPPHHLTPFAVAFAGTKRLGRGSRDFNVQVDAIQQWSGYFSPVSGDLITTATAIRQSVTEKTAGAGIHRRNQLKLRRILGMPARASYAYAPQFQWLTQHLKRPPIELRQFIQKKHAIVCAGYFTGPWTRPATPPALLPMPCGVAIEMVAVASHASQRAYPGRSR